MIRTFALSLAMLALLAPPARAGRDVLRQQSTRAVERTGLAGVRAENSHGDIYASASADDQVHVQAIKIIHSSSRAESERMAREIRVEITHESGQLVVRARYPSRRSIRIGFWDLFNDFEVPSSEVELRLQIPAALPFTARTSSGDVSSDGLSGAQRIESSSGDVHVGSASGPLDLITTSGDVDASDLMRAHVRTVSGDAELRGLRGPLDAHSTSGDLTIRGAADSLLLGTVSGDVEVLDANAGLNITTTNGGIKARRIRGRVDIGASSGNVELGLVPPAVPVSVATGSGDIEVHLDRAMGVRLELQTSNGTLEMDSPIQVLSLTRRRVTGQLRQGTAPVMLRSASGDIHVTTGDQGS